MITILMVVVVSRIPCLVLKKNINILMTATRRGYLLSVLTLRIYSSGFSFLIYNKDDRKFVI